MKKAFLLLIAALICLIGACAGGVNTATGSPSDTPAQTRADGAETAEYSPEPETGTEEVPASGSSETASRQDAAADEAQASSAEAEPESVTPPPGQQTEAPDGETKQQASLPEQTPEQTPEPAAPYSERTADTVLEVCGTGAEKVCYFTMDDLRAMAEGYFEDDYFSRRSGPEEAENRFGGILLPYLLEDVVGLKEGAKKVTVTAADGYADAFSLSAVKASYINEKDLSKTLYMILAWQMDGEALTDSGPLMLVMGQQIEGEYNRQYWVKGVCTIEVKTA